MKNNNPAGLSYESFAAFFDSAHDLRKTAADLACRGYCEYFRDDEGGETGCAGFTAFLHAVAGGKIHQGHLASLLNRPPGVPRKVGQLIEALCMRCSYLKDGCDFMAELHVEGATPCGGYRLFLALLDNSTLGLAELHLSTCLSTPVDKCDPYLTLCT